MNRNEKMANPDMDEIKEIPGYKVIVKAILKNQIQHLVEQLASSTDEECVILTANLTDGSLGHLGTHFGKCFMEDREDVKSQFLDFCLKNHYRDKQHENRQQKAKSSEASIQDSLVERNERSTRSGSLQTSSDRSKESLSVRFEPYPLTRSRRSAITSDTACEPGQGHVIKKLDEHIKVEPTDENEVSNLSESDRPSTSCNVATEANMKVSVNDYPAQQTTQSLVNSDADNTFDETFPCLSVKLEAIAETLKTFAEHDSELEYNDAESMGTVPETEQESKSVEPMGIKHETEPVIMGVEPLENVPDTLPGPMRVELLREMPPIIQVPYDLLEIATGKQKDMCQTGTESSHLTSCDNNGQSLQSNTVLQTHVSIHTDTKPVICNKCGKVFDNSNVSTVTSGNHTIVKPVQCETCSCVSTFEGEFNTPCAKKSENNQHECDHCGKCFPFKSRLNVHLAVHTGIKPFKCKICGKAFTGKQALTRHTVIHSGVKPFKCDICGKTLTHKRNLNAHRALHTGIHRFKCDTCGKSFTHKGNFKSHLASHLGFKPFKCDVCEKSFPQKRNLNAHLVIHSSVRVRPFKCDTCEKSFTEKSKLNRHLAIHSGIKSFKCDTCGKSFTQKHNLAKHIASHSGEKR